MKRMRLHAMAHARSGDKGDGSNVGLIAYDDAGYSILKREVTAARVKTHFGEIVRGGVDRYEVPNLRALNFILHDSLGGGGSASLKTDAQGKTHGMGLLMMEIEVPDDYTPPEAVSGNEYRSPAPEGRPR
jgi:hypothetical protein